MKVFTDADPDGFCGAWVLKTAVESGKLANPDPTFEIFAVDYVKGFPMDIVDKDETVFIVDYSIEPAQMDELLKKTSEVYWIDHHASALEKFEGYDKEIKGLRDTDYASCENCYRFVMGEDAPLPEVVKMVGDFDTWRWQELDNRDAYQFILGISIQNLPPDTGCWETFEENPRKYVAFGKVIDAAKLEEFRGLHEKMFVVDDFEGHKALVLNAPARGFFAFEERTDLDDYEVFLMYHRNDDKYQFSIFSQNESPDVSKIAAKLGGGGHAGAAGFVLEEMPF